MVNEIKTFEERKEELVKLGKEKGFITYEELANKLKGLDLDGDSLDDCRIKACNTCIYKDVPASVDPCGNCDKGSMWEENDLIFHAEICKFYCNGKCVGTREMDPCNYKPLSGCRYYDMYGHKFTN